MSTHKQINLYSINAIQDLSHESAAAISGGIQVYSEASYAGVPLPSEAVADLTQVADGAFNNQTSSLYNDSDQVWAFYTDANYCGMRLALKPGESVSDLRNTYLGDLNDQISSYRSEPTA